MSALYFRLNPFLGLWYLMIATHLYHLLDILRLFQCTQLQNSLIDECLTTVLTELLECHPLLTFIVSSKGVYTCSTPFMCPHSRFPQHVFHNLSYVGKRWKKLHLFFCQIVIFHRECMVHHSISWDSWMALCLNNSF